MEQAQAKYVDDHTKDERAKSLFTPKGFAGNPLIFKPIPSIPSRNLPKCQSEEIGILNLVDEINLCAMHHVYLPRIRR